MKFHSNFQKRRRRRRRVKSMIDWLLDNHSDFQLTIISWMIIINCNTIQIESLMIIMKFVRINVSSISNSIVFELYEFDPWPYSDHKVLEHISTVFHKTFSRRILQIEDNMLMVFPLTSSIHSSYLLGQFHRQKKTWNFLFRRRPTSSPTPRLPHHSSNYTTI